MHVSILLGGYAITCLHNTPPPPPCSCGQDIFDAAVARSDSLHPNTSKAGSTASLWTPPPLQDTVICRVAVVVSVQLIYSSRYSNSPALIVTAYLLLPILISMNLCHNYFPKFPYPLYHISFFVVPCLCWSHMWLLLSTLPLSPFSHISTPAIFHSRI